MPNDINPNTATREEVAKRHAARKISKAVFAELSDRSLGLDSVDPEIQQEIRDVIYDIVLDGMP